MRVLLVEDNDELAETIVERFRSEGHAVDHEADGTEADELLRYKKFDLILLDINLPGRNGYEILRSLRNRRDETPVLVLTARSEIDDRVVGLDSGADDYLVKPFDFRELFARCRVLVRRRSGEARNEVRIGDFMFDRAAKRATVGGRDLELRLREIQLLEVFLGNLDRVLTKEEVADKVYTFAETPSLNAIEQAVTRLRKKTEGTPFVVKTIRGLGYMAHVQEG